MTDKFTPSAHGTPEFQRAAALARAYATAPSPVLGLLRVAPAVPFLVRYLRSLPVVEVRLSDRPAGRALRRHLSRSVVGLPVGRLAAAVLQLPATTQEYLRGRSRQALRTNLTHARRLQVSCREVDDPHDRREVVRAVLQARGTPSAHLEQVTEHSLDRSAELHAAVGPDGAPLAFAGCGIDVEWGHVSQFWSVRTGPAASYARYALHLHLVEQTLTRGAAALCFESALTVPPGLQHLQHLLGFRPVNLRLSDQPPHPRSGGPGQTGSGTPHDL